MMTGRKKNTGGVKDAMPDDFDDDDDFDDSGGGAFLSRCTITTWGGTKKKQQQKGTTTTKRMRFWNTKSVVTMAFDVASLKSFCCAWCFPDAKVVDACAHVSEQIAVVSIVFAMFALVKTEKVRAEEVLGWSVSCAVLGMMCMDDDDDDDDTTTTSTTRRRRQRRRRQKEESIRNPSQTTDSARRWRGIGRRHIVSAFFNHDGVGVGRYRRRGCWDSRFCPSRDARLSRGKHEFRERFRRGEFSVGDF